LFKRRFIMETTVLQKCVDIDSAESFCDCIAGEPMGPAAEALCNRAKAGENISAEDLAEVKMAVLDDNSCCDCC
jgi:hypothetical protein